MNVLLLYDQETRSRYRDKLCRILHDLQLGATLVEVDHPGRSMPVAESFQAKVRQADVILIDVTRQNTDVGYEIGRFLRIQDPRLILFSISEDFPRDLPFYLRGVRAYPLWGVVANSVEGSKQEADFAAAIRVSGLARPLEGLIDEQCSRTTKQILQQIEAWSERIYSAPCAAYVFGEHSVTVGHPAFILPIPRRVYVGVRKARDGITRFRVVPAGCQDLEQAEPLIGTYSGLRRTLSRWCEPLDVMICAELPTMCGLGTSSAVSACLALEALRLDSTSVPSQQTEHAVNVLADETVNRAFRVAWRLDAAFHSILGSGAGVFAALTGVDSASPLLFFSEPRLMWAGDSGRFARDLLSDDAGATKNRDALDAIQCVGFRIRTPDRVFQEGHFALVYSGTQKTTAECLDLQQSVGQYFSAYPALVRQLIDAIAHEHIEVRYPLSQRLRSEYVAALDAVAGSGGTAEWGRTQHEGAIRETLYAMYGCATLVGMNSFWSGDHLFLTLMGGCQKVLEALRLDRAQQHGVTRFDLAVLADALNSVRDASGRRLFGAKTTGGGMGGDVLVWSSQNDGRDFERCLRHGILHARDEVGVSREGFGAVHFSSTTLEGYPEHYRVLGARRLRTIS